MKIYLAGSISQENRTLMTNIAKRLRRIAAKDIEVYCPWEFKIDNGWAISQEEWAEKVFCKDVEAIRECDIFILITPGRASTAGSNFEQGMAFALHKQIFVFQITDEPTSIMTFCGANYFFNCTRDNILKKVDYAAICLEEDLTIYQDNKDWCKTVLT